MADVIARADVAVVGLGAMGAMTAWQAAARGATVVGVERFQPAHAYGSSHGGSRIFRMTLFEGPEYVPIARRSLRLWRQLEAETGSALLTTSGGLVIGPEDGPLVTDAIRSCTAGGVEHQLLDTDELRGRYPQHAVFDGDVAVYEPSAGVLRPEAAIVAALDQAKSHGATLLTETTLQSMRLGESEVEVVTDRGVVLASTVVVATGGWLQDTVADLELPLRTQRSCLTWFKPKSAAAPGAYGPQHFPVFVRESGHLGGWGIPDIDGRGMKLGVGGSAGKPWLERPEDNWTPPTATDLAPMEAFCRDAFPGLVPQAAEAAACMNSKTPDGDFVVGSPTAAPQLVVLGGFSGHGFKHAAGIGAIGADLALDGGTAINIERFSPDRFEDAVWPT